MQNSDVEGEVFFDSYDSIRSSVDSVSSYCSVDDEQKAELRIFDPQIWTSDMMSVSERRKRFLHRTGFDEFISSKTNHSQGVTTLGHIELNRLKESSGAALDSFSTYDNGRTGDSLCCISDSDNGENVVVHEHGDFFDMFKEVGSDKLMTAQDFKKLCGLPCSTRKSMQRKGLTSGWYVTEIFATKKKEVTSWFRRLMSKKHSVGLCRTDVSVKNSQVPRTMRTDVIHHRKRFRELTALIIGQEIQAHNGLIRAMKFSPSGWFIASGGEDCILRIWQIREVEPSCIFTVASASEENLAGVRSNKSLLVKKGGNSLPIIIPKKTFKIMETPFQEFHGHTCDILDLSWCNSDCLITSSMDKTVRMWKIGYDGCQNVFRHNDYELLAFTCVQFNPVDEKYFISGSIDGKIRIWSVLENRVVDWADVRDIVTSVCYQPDGKFSPEDPEKVMITSIDSRVRISDGFDVIHKFKGLRKTKSHLCASFTSDGQYIVSVGEDSNIYVWNCDLSRKSSSKLVKSVRSFEAFFSERASVAIPWTSMNHRGYSSTSGLHLPAKALTILEPSTCLWDSDCFYLGSWLFADGASRVGPEDKLPTAPATSPNADKHHLGNHHHHNVSYHRYQQLTSLAATWSMVIVTASSDGFIRSFHNYGLPVLL
ncbi:Protein Mut11 [Apostasia shenzhenica]|uniref:Protein Mut11 n=1 Tax=Apostasia shenzhenica TaxID=1088818 RepID=A0A2I0AEL2_9ASPA|nr:Protein Mut11 [Apostasia shenzhenica]